MDKNDAGGICDGLRAIFELQKEHAVTAGRLDVNPIVLCVVARCLEWFSAYSSASRCFALIAPLPAPSPSLQSPFLMPNLVFGLACAPMWSYMEA